MWFQTQHEPNQNLKASVSFNAALARHDRLFFRPTGSSRAVEGHQTGWRGGDNGESRAGDERPGRDQVGPALTQHDGRHGDAVHGHTGDVCAAQAQPIQSIQVEFHFLCTFAIDYTCIGLFGKKGFLYQIHTNSSCFDFFNIIQFVVSFDVFIYHEFLSEIYLVYIIVQTIAHIV